MRRHVSGLIMLFLAIVGMVGCGSSEEASPNAQVYRVRGKLLGVTADGHSIVVAHEAIEAANMEAMTMTFRLRDTTALSGLETGAKISFDLVIAGALYAENLTELPQDTPLKLPSDTTATDSLS